ncbi:hypothetical protein EJ05DRAFT_473167 [Pseudovirgaria hyperparasitica]|uniref:BHLH domain-containing protein n=1 Tax=Pseudovirgaria hyperparasitica TaxID=470096 RepID=A0A6A6WJW0_9PEZI|nr:uncharacterized protein EJ05DRAFT_473167 [Pseudovirgaria hyperparasitica]KAF2762247.1 hypothetical protein EJ05DRAFT_473167 [Pseudovirgaria hyperparasitica]
MNYPNPIHKPTFEAPAAYTYPSEPTAAKVPIIKSDPTTPTFNFNRPTSPSPTLSSCAGSSSLSSGSQDLLSTVPTASILKSSDSPSESPPAKRLLRRRGRPRLPSPDDENFDPTSSRPRRARLPHNQVERKYRQGLNAELDRLRLAIPILPQPSPEEGSSAPKPSKATVLASAIKYIQGLESERDLLKEENSELRKQAAMMGASAVLGKRAAVRR